MGPRVVAELQQQLQSKESERDSLAEQLEREREEKETKQEELVRQTQMCFITIFNSFI